MPCDHVGPPQLIEMAEKHLREQKLDPQLWPGWRFGYAEDLGDGRVIRLEVVRRDEGWLVTRLDRSGPPLGDGENGFRVLGTAG